MSGRPDWLKCENCVWWEPPFSRDLPPRSYGNVAEKAQYMANHCGVDISDEKVVKSWVAMQSDNFLTTFKGIGPMMVMRLRLYSDSPGLARGTCREVPSGRTVDLGWWCSRFREHWPQREPPDVVMPLPDAP